MLRELNTKKWLPIADSTVYATINSLKKKKLIEGRTEKTAGAPEKTIYSITEIGNYELRDSVSKFLYEKIPQTSNFDIGILLMHNLSKMDVLNKLKKKLEQHESNAHEIRKQVLKFEMQLDKISFTSLSMLKHRLHILEAEIKTIRELIKELNVRNAVSEKSPFDLRMI
jgi:DNA-binding PadR family transcriptional regulator